ncbi:hypothetical protein ACSTLN_23830, partial [Vibrio parahaemolyticus]
KVGDKAVLERLQNRGFDLKRAQELMTKDFAGRVGFPDYAFKNAAGERKRLKERIAALEKHAKDGPRAAKT